MISIGLFLLIIMPGCILLATYKKPIKNTFPVCCFSLILWIFVLGIATDLGVALGTVAIFSVIMLGIAILRVVKFNLISDVFESIHWWWIPMAFSLGFFLWCDYGMRAGFSSDDFSHWIYVVQEMVRLDDFGTNPAANAPFASYPPGMAIFQYVAVKLHFLTNTQAGFSEWRCFWAYHVLLISTFFPFLGKSKKPAESVVLVLTFFLLPTAFYPAYIDPGIDMMLAVVAGTAFARVLLDNEKDSMYHAYVLESCAMLVLLKDSGVVFAIVIFWAWLLDFLWMQKKADKIRKQNVQFVAWGGVTSVILPKLLWNFEVSRNSVARAFSQGVSLEKIFNMLAGRDDFSKGVIKNFIEALFSRNVVIDTPWHGLQPGMEISYVNLIAVFAVCFVVVHQFRRDRISNVASSIGMKKRTVLISMWFVLVVFYIMGIGIAYISNFTPYEAGILASFARYVQVPFLATYILLILDVLDVAATMGPRASWVKLVVFVLVLCLSPRLYAWDYICRDFVADSKMRRETYDSVSDIIISTCDEADRICYIDQQSWHYPYFMVSYAARPRVVTALDGSWCLDGSTANVEENKTKICTEFDYVVVCQVDDYLVQTYGDMFDGVIETDTLWKVDREMGRLEQVT